MTTTGINIFRMLLAMTLTGSVIAAILFVIKPIIKNKLSKTFQYYIWLLVIITLLIPIPLSIPVNMSTTKVKTDDSVITVIEPMLTVRDVVDKFIFSTEVKDDKKSLPIFTAKAILVYWFIGFLVFLGINISTYFIFVKKLEKTVVEFDASCTWMYVFKSKFVSTPMLLGIFRPAIILPDREYEEEQINNIILHETWHYKRRDLILKWVVTITNAVHWFNPIAYLIRKEINIACELSCDEAVIRKMSDENKQSYGDTLISVVADRRCPVGIVSMTMCEDKQKLKDRLLSIMQYKRISKLFIAISIGMITFLSGGVIVLNARTVFDLSSNILVTDSVETEKNILDLMGSSSEHLYIDLDKAKPFEITTELKLSRFTNDVYTIETNGIAQNYQLQYQLGNSEKSLKIIKTGNIPIPNNSVSISVFFDALKYLPKDDIMRESVVEPKKFFVSFGEGEVINGYHIYYNAQGDMSQHYQDLLILTLVPDYSEKSEKLLSKLQAVDKTLILNYYLAYRNIKILTEEKDKARQIALQAVQDYIRGSGSTDNRAEPIVVNYENGNPFFIFELWNEYIAITVSKTIDGQWHSRISNEKKYGRHIQLIYKGYYGEGDNEKLFLVSKILSDEVAFIGVGTGKNLDIKSIGGQKIVSMLFEESKYRSLDDPIAYSKEGIPLYHIRVLREDDNFLPILTAWVPIPYYNLLKKYYRK